MKITAQPVAYSSVVGSGIALHDESGAVIGTLAFRGTAWLDTTEHGPLMAKLVAAINAGQPERRIHHPGRGSDYDVVASAALFQVSEPPGLDGPARIIHDGDKVAVYRNEHGTFVRFVDEMVEPRFKEI